MLSMTASSPLREPQSHHDIGRSCSSVGSANSTRTVQHYRLRSLSGSSLSSLTSLWAPPFRRNDESLLSRSPSSHHTILRRFATASDRQSTSGSYSRRSSLVSVLSSRLRVEPATEVEVPEARLLDVAEHDDDVRGASDGGISPDDVEELTAEHLPVAVPITLTTPPLTDSPSKPCTPPKLHSSPKPAGVRRWLSVLRRRKQQHPPQRSPRGKLWTLDNFGSRSVSPVKGKPPQHKNTDSQGSSFAFVSAVRSATATIASVSVATVSRGNAGWRRGHHRSSMISGSDPRPSIDSVRSVMDEAAKQRSRKRREKIEELIRTEENYVADIKALSNV